MANLPSFLTSEDLGEIQRAFQENDSTLVDKQTFIDMLMTHLGKGAAEDYGQLFDDIDISRDGVVDWDCLCNHLLLSFYEQDQRIKITQVPEWKPLKTIQTPHRDSIIRIICCDQPHKFCVVSKDGFIAFLNDSYEVKRSFKLSTDGDEMKEKDLWVTDAVYMQNISKLAVCTTAKDILFYDCLQRDFGCQYKFQRLSAIPLCLAYWHCAEKRSKTVLCYGDSKGYVYVITFDDVNSFFGKPVKDENNRMICVRVNLSDVIARRVLSVGCVSHHGHKGNWVRKVAYMPTLECFVSCSTSEKCSLVLGWISKEDKMRLTEFDITLGVNDFDYHRRLNVVATGGVNTHVCLWNPFVAVKPVGVLRGHMTVVVAVQFIVAKNQLLSLSKDRAIRLWDVNLQLCLQRLLNVLPKGNEVHISMYYDEKGMRFFAAMRQNLVVLEANQNTVKDRAVSHDAPVTDFVYNQRFDQLITVGEDSCLNIWMFGTGQKVKSFTDSHQGAEITAVTLAHSETRIFTAGTDGTIRVWDLNGTCFHVVEVDEGHPSEITQILFLRRMILAIGWSRQICCVMHGKLKSYYGSSLPWKGKQEHTDDIIAMDFLEPRTLMTTSCDGDIVFWNTDTQSSLRTIATSDKPTPRSARLTPLSSKSRVKSRSFVKSSMSHKISEDRSKDVHLNEDRDSLSRNRSCSLPRQSPFETTTPIPRIPRKFSQSGNIHSAAEASISVPVTSVKFINKRKGNDAFVADIFSCHANGLVLFWNSLTCMKLDQIQAFNCHGSLVSGLDSSNRYLCVGAENGTVKMWDIEQFHNSSMEENKAVLVATLTSHIDAVTALKFIEQHDTKFLVTSSADCSVAVHCFDEKIGVFGQTQHWNISDIAKTFDKKRLMKHVADVKNLTVEPENLKNKQPEIKSLMITDDTAEMSENIKRVDTSAYANIYKAKPQKARLPQESFANAISSGIIYRCLKTGTLEETSLLSKPDFMLYPDKYLLGTNDNTAPSPAPLNHLQNPVNEATLFPSISLYNSGVADFRGKKGERANRFSKRADSNIKPIKFVKQTSKSNNVK